MHQVGTRECVCQSVNVHNIRYCQPTKPANVYGGSESENAVHVVI